MKEAVRGWLLAVQTGVDFAQQIAWDDSRHGSDETAIPRRACRKPATSGALDGRPGNSSQRGSCRGRTSRKSRTNASAKRWPCRRGSVSVPLRMANTASVVGASFSTTSATALDRRRWSARFPFGCTTVQPPRRIREPRVTARVTRGVNLYRPTISPRSKP